MDPQNDKLSTCQAIGMNCHECVSRSAQQLAVACGAMSYQDVDRIFQVMYDHEVCSRMRIEFIRAYQEEAAIHSDPEPEASGFNFLPSPAYSF